MVAVINETAARLYWSGDDPIGRTIRYYPQETNPSIQIVGIVGDVRSIGASEPAPPAVYVPLAQAPRPPYEGRSMTFIVRVPGNPAAVAASARAAVASIDAGLPLANLRPMSEVRHPPRSGWLDELGRLKGGRAMGLDAARCAS